jgi:hypothetical protein
MGSDFGTCYETTKDRYVFNVAQIHPSVTRDVECVNETLGIYCWKHNEILIQWQNIRLRFRVAIYLSQ